ncbi:MAG: Asp-tRNA(Asn)/Glu-tRNA(Gln) amidotransferase subunit GatB [Coriobacteriales bacterium]|nr:Asp-tRNA(Asn)/Glu-tRNA(Gln) amidotransferase subunit GatB [Coriobacteriales bacterium]
MASNEIIMGMAASTLGTPMADASDLTLGPSGTAYETVIGLEVHVELATKSKLFCSCANESGAEQNTHVCPACCGMPGMLPVTNKRVVELGMTAGMMLHCHINRTTTFDKKSYYYPDLPCSYQVTQWFAPICVNGSVHIETSKGGKDIRIKQIHMEEDAGKLVHSAWTNTTMVDFNRTSVPLCEIVSQPDMRSAEDVVAYLERLRALLRFAKVSECRFERGTMRCDVNLSVRPAGSDALGVRTEMKNMNSISAIERAIAYEVKRHIDAIETGSEELVQETRGWDDEKGVSFSMRNKETAADYRYFPDPNIMPVVIDDAWYASVEASLPDFPEVVRARYIDELGLSEYDADILSGSRACSDVFDAAFAVCGQAKETANWIISNCLGFLNRKQLTADELDIDGTALGKLIKLVADGTVSSANAKRILAALFDGETDPEAYAKRSGLIIGEGADDLVTGVIAKVLAANAADVEAYRGGREKALQPLIGKCMKELRGNCDPKALRQQIIDAINAG